MHTRGQISTQPTKKATSLEVSFGVQREMFKSFVGLRPGPFSACNLCSFSNRKFDLRPKWKLRVTTIYVRKYGLGFSPSLAFLNGAQSRDLRLRLRRPNFPAIHITVRVRVLCVQARGTLFYSRGPFLVCGLQCYHSYLSYEGTPHLHYSTI